MFVYMIHSDIVGISDSFERMAFFAEDRSDGSISHRDWFRHDSGSWNPVSGKFDRVWFSHPSTEAIIVEVRGNI
jgi:hypothetical protein